ncbi:hypothetical protein CDD83_11220 [Cordyceps sp. RAO-2017]|nr:hypothetical protein CDD83_11220 [Cordyceps sp. RAO-2017]
MSTDLVHFVPSNGTPARALLAKSARRMFPAAEKSRSRVAHADTHLQPVNLGPRAAAAIGRGKQLGRHLDASQRRQPALQPLKWLGCTSSVSGLPPALPHDQMALSWAALPSALPPALPPLPQARYKKLPTCSNLSPQGRRLRPAEARRAAKVPARYRPEMRPALLGPLFRGFLYLAPIGQHGRAARTQYGLARASEVAAGPVPPVAELHCLLHDPEPSAHWLADLPPFARVCPPSPHSSSPSWGRERAREEKKKTHTTTESRGRGRESVRLLLFLLLSQPLSPPRPPRRLGPSSSSDRSLLDERLDAA